MRSKDMPEDEVDPALVAAEQMLAQEIREDEDSRNIVICKQCCYEVLLSIMY